MVESDGGGNGVLGEPRHACADLGQRGSPRQIPGHGVQKHAPAQHTQRAGNRAGIVARHGLIRSGTLVASQEGRIDGASEPGAVGGVRRQRALGVMAELQAREWIHGRDKNAAPTRQDGGGGRRQEAAAGPSATMPQDAA